jgi:hypothetical protein
MFSVSYDWVKKIFSQRLHSQQMERVPQSRYGAVSRVTLAVEAELLRQLREQPDRTSAELQKGLLRTTHRCRRALPESSGQGDRSLCR